jgi:hypothetical protein
MLLRPALAVLLAFVLSPAWADPPAPERLADLLFPESKAWPRFAELPAVPPRELDMYLVERLDRGLPRDRVTPECSFTIRTFVAPEPGASLRRLALGAGDPQLAFSGLNPCAEGALTLIWPGPKSDTLEARAFPAQLLRVRPGAAARATAIEPGCCGDPIDQFHLLTLAGSSTPVRLKSTNLLVVPDSAVEERGTLKLEREVVLRFTPELKDEHDPDLSEFLDRAAFGNIARKYLGGIEAEQLLRYEDDKGRLWRLVLIGNVHNKRAFHNALPVNVGWISE